MQLKTETKVGLFVLVSIGLFIYASIYLGVFRFYVRDYRHYYVYFDDINGLLRKADVKISGVKVGWVDDINLVANGARAKVKLMIFGQYILYSDAYAEIRQDGLISSKYVEVFPGSAGLRMLRPGETLSREGRPAAAIDDIMHRFESIAHNIEDVSSSLKNVFAGEGQQEQLKSIISNINQAAERIAVFSDVLSRNEQNIDKMLNNFSGFSNDIRKLTERLDTDVFPSFQNSIEKISQVFDRDFNRVADRLDSTMKEISCVAQKINSGQGFIGKLVNETDVYDDIKVVAKGFREAAEFVDNMELVVDTHMESMQRPAEHYDHKESKGYIDLRLHTREDLFYLFQIVGSEKGSIQRTVARNTFFAQDEILGTKCGEVDSHPLTLAEINADYSGAFYFPPPRTDTLINIRNTTKFGFQVGKIFDNIAFRFGLFENTVGMGIDYELPFCNENFRWVTSLEMFDFRGQDRVNDRRPHLKWINRMYMMRNLYMNFGVDDFISRQNANAFLGLGIRFGDNDLKYLLSKIGFLAGGTAGSSSIQE